MKALILALALAAAAPAARAQTTPAAAPAPTYGAPISMEAAQALLTRALDAAWTTPSTAPSLWLSARRGPPPAIAWRPR